jgi:hypothetical protein
LALYLLQHTATVLLIMIKLSHFTFILLTGIFGFLQLNKGEPNTAMLEFAFASGNSEFIAEHLKDKCSISIEGHEDVYSPSQAELILSNYFQKTKPTALRGIKKAPLEGGKYLLSGNLITDEKTLKLSFYYSEKKGKAFIYKMKID